MRGGIEQRDFTRPGGGDPKIRDVERRAHGAARQGELTETIDELDAEREARRESLLDELHALGVTIVLEGEHADFPLKLDSLDSWSRHRKEPKRPRWLLLSVMPAANGRPERATVWVSDAYRGAFLKLFQDYLEKTRSDSGNPYHRALVANIGRIRRAVLEDLWQSDGSPIRGRSRWWELWLAPSADAVTLLSTFAAERSLPLADRVLRFGDRTVTWIKSTWDELEVLPFTSVPLAEIREPEFIDTIEDLARDDQDALTSDLAERLSAAPRLLPPCATSTPASAQSHVLLHDSLATTDVHSIFGDGAAPTQNHGTLMAGLGLLGLARRDPLEHSQRRASAPSRVGQDPSGPRPQRSTRLRPRHGTGRRSARGDRWRPRVFCMPVTAPPERIGEPSLWSASVDALAAGLPSRVLTTASACSASRIPMPRGCSSSRPATSSRRTSQRTTAPCVTLAVGGSRACVERGGGRRLHRSRQAARAPRLRRVDTRRRTRRHLAAQPDILALRRSGMADQARHLHGGRQPLGGRRRASSIRIRCCPCGRPTPATTLR